MKTHPLRLCGAASLLALALAAACWLVPGGVAAQPGGSPSDRVVRYLVLPHLEPPAEERPSQASIRRFLAAHPEVENSTESIGRNLEFARTVLGQRRIFQYVRMFEASHPRTQVKITFLRPSSWFGHVQAEIDSGGTPFVALIGDTWEPGLRARGVLGPGDASRYFNDVRLLWYWRDMVRPGELRDWSSFLVAAERLKREGILPLAVSSSRDADCVWNFDVWLRAAGGQMAYVEHGWLGWRGWHPVWRNWVESSLADEHGRLAATALSTLVEHDYLALPETPNTALTRDFLDRKMAMVIMEPWVAWQAERLWRERPGWVAREGLPAAWPQAIGAALPPALGGDKSGTFIGGSMLAVVDPLHGADRDLVEQSREWMRFLISQTANEAEMETLQFLPASEEAWRVYPHRAFFDQALAGMGGDASPRSLLRLRRQEGPPPIPEWAMAVERPDVTEQFYWFWKRLDGLPRGLPPEALASREHGLRLVEQALVTAADEMNANLSPGQWWVRLLLFMLVALPAAALLAAGGQRLTLLRRERRWRENLARERETVAILERRLRSVEEMLTLTRTHLTEEAPDDAAPVS